MAKGKRFLMTIPGPQYELILKIAEKENYGKHEWQRKSTVQSVICDIISGEISRKQLWKKYKAEKPLVDTY